MLTDLAIRSAEPVTTLWDGNLKGFGIRIGKERKTFMVLIASGRRQTIGHYPLMSLVDARREARRILAEKELGKVRPRFTAFDDAKATYLTECEQKNRALTVRDYRRHLAVHFSFGRKALGDITPRDVLRQLAPLPPSEKHHAFTAARAFFRWCVRQHLIDRSPMENMQTPPSGRSRERVLSPDELQSLLEGLRYDVSPFKRLVLLLLYTGQRRNEISHLEWSWIDDYNRLITFPASITKNKRPHTIPYGDLTWKILDTIPVVVGCPYVFPAARKISESTTVLNGFGKPKRQLDKELADKLQLWQLHDLRRTYSSTMASLGVAQIVVEKLLNHVSGGTQSPISQVYNKYSYLPEAREAVLKYETYLRNLVAPKGCHP